MWKTFQEAERHFEVGWDKNGGRLCLFLETNLVLIVAYSCIWCDYDKDIRSREIFLDVVFAELVLKLLLQVFFSQFLISILLDQNRFLQIVHYLQNQYQLLFTHQLHPL